LWNSDLATSVQTPFPTDKWRGPKVAKFNINLGDGFSSFPALWAHKNLV